ncbi:MAG: DUF3747 domain-containing protein [Cyanobium sp.]
MKRTYLALAGLALAGSATPAALPPLVRAAGLFQSQPLDASRFAVLARPVGQNDWNLLVLEQVAAAPRCWTPLSDGLVEPSLNQFDYTGICGRYLDSNGYSLRIGEQDLATSYRLRLLLQGNQLLLQALSPNEPTVLVVGRAVVPRRDRENFVALQLDPGWQLQRRTFGRQTLNHLYFANPSPLRQLIAQAGGATSVATLPTLPPQPPTIGLPARAPQRDARQPAQLRRDLRQALQLTQPEAQSQPLETIPAALPGRTIALPVIPFRE